MRRIALALTKSEGEGKKTGIRLRNCVYRIGPVYARIQFCGLLLLLNICVLRAALSAHSLQMVSEGDYVRNTVEVQEAFSRVMDGDPEAVILFGADAACAHLIRYARRQAGRPLILCCASNVDLEYVQRVPGPRAGGVIGSQVMPFPPGSGSELVRDYQADMIVRGYRQFTHASLEGYAGARVFVAALQNAGPALINGLANGIFTCGPLMFGFDGNLQQRNYAVFLTQISHGRLVPTQQIGLPSR